jgi:hypothetical protein
MAQRDFRMEVCDLKLFFLAVGPRKIRREIEAPIAIIFSNIFST